ncbi:beta-propeller fold lactonase family protein [Pseudoxanthomonas sp. 10H]|uniref:beta-propeller fold lactonase family protein n=1 Tax=Pseudoxanthomonas sp. 10H TaxID=3242729 RepID=UPI00355926F8
MTRTSLHRLGLCAALFAVAGSAHAAELLVGNKAADTLWRLSLEDGRKRGEAATAPGPHEIAVSPDGRIAVVSEYGRQSPGNTLGVYDAVGGRLLRRIALGAHTRPHGLRFLDDDHRLLATAEGSDALLVVDVDAGKVERAIDIGPGKGHMVALAADRKVAYVSKVGAGTVARIDLASGEVLERPAGAGAEGIAVAADGSVWVSNREEETLTVHDAATLEVLDTLASDGFPIRIVFTPSGRHALVTNARAATLAVFDAVTRDPVALVELARPGASYRETMLGRAALPIGAIVDPSGRRAYVAVSGGNEIAVVDTASWTVVERWATGEEPDALGIVGAAAAPPARAK